MDDLDHLELGVEMHLVELVDEDHGGVAIGGEVAGGDLDLEPVGWVRSRDSP